MKRIDCEGFHRRDFLKVGAAGGLFGLTLPDLLRLEGRAADDRKSKKATSVILVWLAGGLSAIDTLDMKPHAPEGIRGEFKPMKSSVPGLDVTEFLPDTAKVMHHLTLVRSMAHTLAVHGPGTIYVTTGNKPTPALKYPALGALASKILPAGQGVPSYVTFGELRDGTAGGGGYLGTAYNPFNIEGAGNIDKGVKKGEPTEINFRVSGITLPTGFTVQDLEDRNKLLQTFDQGLRNLDRSSELTVGLDAFHLKALDILRSDQTKKAFDLEQEPKARRERYGLHGFGQSALAARRLVEAGVRFVTIGFGGWDTHQKNFSSLKEELLPRFDKTFSALIEDLADRGLLDRTIVYCAGEFGRTPKINKDAGRDHWARSSSVLLAGGGFKKGYVHGATDAECAVPVSDPCTPDDVSATIFHALGVDPHQELLTSTGRPIQMFRDGKVVEKLFA